MNQYPYPCYIFLKFYFSLLFLSFFINCFGVSNIDPQNHDQPWFTGPLLTPSARVIPKGHANLEPYLFWTVTTGRYGNHWKAQKIPSFNQINPQLQVKIGLTDKLDLTSSIQSVINFSRGKMGSSFGDFFLGFDYQLFKGKPEDWLSYAKFSIVETFPTGKYQKLNPKHFGTDIGGQGSYVTNVGITISKLFPLSKNRFLGTRCNLAAFFAAPTSVRGFNIYGGGDGTRGTINPGLSFILSAGTEFTLTKKFTLACDFQAQYGKKSHFKGRTFTPVKEPEFFQFSLAPALEYNWNSSMGIIVGTWFTLAGKNSSRFLSGVAAYNYYF